MGTHVNGCHGGVSEHIPDIVNVHVTGRLWRRPRRQHYLASHLRAEVNVYYCYYNYYP